MSQHRSAGARYRWLAIGVLLAVGSPLAAQATPKYLIEFGWDRPSPAALRARLALAESRPFDGVVFRFAGGQRAFLTTRLDSAALDEDVRELRASDFKQLRHNFVLLQAVCDSAWNWLDDRHWRAAEWNVRQFARAARAGGLVGIAFDYEHYGPKIWDGQRIPLPASVSASELWRVVRRRGARFMMALQDEFPGITVLSFFQLSMLAPVAAISDPTTRAARLRAGEYELIVPFVEGMVLAADSSVSIVDGNELGYYNGTDQEFREARRTARDRVATLLGPRFRGPYSRKIEVGQPIFYDYLLHIYKRRNDDRPARLTHAERLAWLTGNTRRALEQADRYAWLYSQRIDWWGTEVPADVEAAVRRGREEGRAEPGTTVTHDSASTP